MALDIGKMWSRIYGLVIFGWIIAVIRFALEITAPDQAMFFGVYYGMVVAYLYYGIKGKMDDLSWARLAQAMVMIALLVWFIPNAIAYSVAQFMGWQHGRFAEETSGPIQPTASGKIMSGVGTAFGTFIGGTVWSLVLGTLFIWVPGLLRKRARKSSA
ncbi:MAG: hypothetical protein FJY97_21105 [candidate division Zixibacteria bacterium]|nr:hypothetical protein [candidate division Zixibacteria bacterium]